MSRAVEAGRNAETGSEAAYLAALARFRRERPDEARAAYIEADIESAARRFCESDKFRSTLALLRKHGLRQGARILDLGAGNGIAAIGFARHGYTVTAVEPCSSDDYGAGAIRLLAQRFAVGVEIVSCRGERLPFPGAFFDVVYVRACLHHAEDLGLMVKEAARVLRTGGLFLALREHVVSNARELERFRAEHPMVQFGVTENAYTRAEYLSALHAAGLRPLRIFRPQDFPFSLDAESIRLGLVPLRNRLSDWCGAHSAELVAEVAAWVLRQRPTACALNLLRRRPGRLYGFLARKGRS